MVSETAYSDYTSDSQGLYWSWFNDNGFASPWAPRLWRTSAGINYTISGLVTLVVVVAYALFYPSCHHWCLLPLFICGALSGVGLVSWLRKEVDTMDAMPLVSFSLYLACFLAPLLHLAFESYGEDFYINDWGKYMGYMAMFNLFGIVVFKVGHHASFRRSRPVKKIWRIEGGKFYSIIIPAIGISILASLVIRLLFSGLVREGGREAMFMGAAGEYSAHLSWILMLADPAIVLCMTGLIYWLSDKDSMRQRSIVTVALLMILTMILQFLLVGMRGSRSAVVFGVVLVGAIIHYRLRPISVKLVVLGMFFIVLFVYLYGFYKQLGPRGWQAFYSKEARKSMQYELGESGLLSTFASRGKADVQAFILYRLIEFKGSYEPVHGQTYLMSLLKFIPRGIWKSKPEAKMKAGTAIQGFSSTRTSHRVYGLAGEAMLNFSYYGIIPAFFVFGIFIGWFRKKVATMEPFDARFFLVPFAMLTCALAVSSDSDNLVFGLLKQGGLPFIVILLSSTRLRLLSAEVPQQTEDTT